MLFICRLNSEIQGFNFPRAGERACNFRDFIKLSLLFYFDDFCEIYFSY